MLIISRPVMRTGPEVPQEASQLAGCEENTLTNIHVPFIATARATIGI